MRALRAAPMRRTSAETLAQKLLRPHLMVLNSAQTHACKCIIWIVLAFLMGYFTGIYTGRLDRLQIFSQYTDYLMQAQTYASFWQNWLRLFSIAFLQASFVYVCGFHLWGYVLISSCFAFKGAMLGMCASRIYNTGGARQLLFYWILNFLPELTLSALILWLAYTACGVCKRIADTAFLGCRGTLGSAVRRLSIRYLFCAAACAFGSALFSGSAIIFVNVIFS